MTTSEIDPVGMGILYLLQKNARDTTVAEISEQVNVAPSTVAARIRDLEESNVIKGYIPVIDYEETGFDHKYIIVGTGPEPFEERDEFTDALLDVHGVVNVRAFSIDSENITVEVVGETRQEVFTDLAKLNEFSRKARRTNRARVPLLPKAVNALRDGRGRHLPTTAESYIGLCSL